MFLRMVQKGMDASCGRLNLEGGGRLCTGWRVNNAFTENKNAPQVIQSFILLPLLARVHVTFSLRSEESFQCTRVC